MWTDGLCTEAAVVSVFYGWSSTVLRPANASLQTVIPTMHTCEDD